MRVVFLVRPQQKFGAIHNEPPRPLKCEVYGTTYIFQLIYLVQKVKIVFRIDKKIGVVDADRPLAVVKTCSCKHYYYRQSGSSL